MNSIEIARIQAQLADLENQRRYLEHKLRALQERKTA